MTAATGSIRVPLRPRFPTGIRLSIRCYSGIEARGRKDISKACENGSSEISCESKCVGTSSLVIDTIIYDLIEGTM